MNLSPNPSEIFCNQYDFESLWDLRHIAFIVFEPVKLTSKKIHDFLALNNVRFKGQSRWESILWRKWK